MKKNPLLQTTILFTLLFLYSELWSQPLLLEEKIPPLHHRTNIIMPNNLLIPSSLTFEVTKNNRQKVVCKTCHGINDIQEKKFSLIDKQENNFLRNGPYEPLSDFCYLCHKRKENKRENIHILLDGDKKKEQQCLYCHTEVLEQNKLENTAGPMTAWQKIDLKLRLPVEKICYGCHLRTPHLNALEHQVKVKDDTMLLYLEKSRTLYNVTMPLGEDNQLLCITCHDPHQQGVLIIKEQEKHLRISADLHKGITYKKHPWGEVYANDKSDRLQQLNKEIKPANKSLAKQKPESISLLRYKRITNEVLLRLPAKNGTLCIACHDFSQERLW